jgi:hypothetical protein
VPNVIEFIATGRATPALVDALGQAEEQVKTLKPDGEHGGRSPGRLYPVASSMDHRPYPAAQRPAVSAATDVRDAVLSPSPAIRRRPASHVF